ncbi:unnamed protein product [Chrysodeixis includens]|uniref:Uncharacterized protein n=1 Tax=Chrysodeixis includens TaxID=689277 RepID=A0A9P0BRJ7_CHRIL|nr:unnamed protein product [Chrysodeixis includens]
MDYVNLKHFKFLNATSHRISRRDPRYYLDLYMETKTVLDERTWISIVFYQFLTNRYRPSFIELNFVLCEMLKDDKFMGSPFRMALHNKTCPFPPGKYLLANMTLLPVLPPGFPFTKGRIVANLTFHDGDHIDYAAHGYLDIEIKTAKMKSSV